MQINYHAFYLCNLHFYLVPFDIFSLLCFTCISYFLVGIDWNSGMPF